MPSRNEPCLCGSGEKFKRCCSDRYDGRRPGEKVRAELELKNYHQALLECRADITQYTIWHKTNTAPLIKKKVEVVEFLLDIDINALSELVYLLYICYLNSGLSDKFSATLERLRSNIDCQRWQRKIIYFQAINALGPEWDVMAGRRELKKLRPIKAEIDIETLQLYIDIFNVELGFSEKQELIDRILDLTDKHSDKLQYSCLKGVEYLMVGDQAGAEQQLETAINSYTYSRSVDGNTAYETYRYAMVLALLGKLRNDNQLLDEAIHLNNNFLESDDWTEIGKASIFREIGDIYRTKSEWNSAYEAYKRAFSIHPIPIYKVFLSECLLHKNGWSDAADLIFTIDPAELEQSEYMDYAFTFAVIAIESGDKKMLATCEEMLRELSISSLFFRARRDDLLLNLIDTIREGTSNAANQKARNILKAITSMAKYIKLEPNFMGIGINLGKMLEDSINTEKVHSEKRNYKKAKK